MCRPLYKLRNYVTHLNGQIQDWVNQFQISIGQKISLSEFKVVYSISIWEWYDYDGYPFQVNLYIDPEEEQYILSRCWGSFFYHKEEDVKHDKHMNTFWGRIISQCNAIAVPLIEYIAGQLAMWSNDWNIMKIFLLLYKGHCIWYCIDLISRSSKLHTIIIL